MSPEPDRRHREINPATQVALIVLFAAVLAVLAFAAASMVLV
jgi:hypothetical protein